MKIISGYGSRLHWRIVVYVHYHSELFINSQRRRKVNQKWWQNDKTQGGMARSHKLIIHKWTKRSIRSDIPLWPRLEIHKYFVQRLRRLVKQPNIHRQTTQRYTDVIQWECWLEAAAWADTTGRLDNTIELNKLRFTTVSPLIPVRDRTLDWDRINWCNLKFERPRWVSYANLYCKHLINIFQVWKVTLAYE